MKTFKHFLMESVRSYKYKIRICGEVDKNTLTLFVHNLQKFDPVAIGEPKSTPVQKSPVGFKHASNQPVMMFDVEFKYPCTEPMVKQLARLLKIDENNVRMLQADYVDSVDAEQEQFDNQVSHSPVLTHEELEDAGKEANKEYASQYMERVRNSYERERTNMSFAGAKTDAAKNSVATPGNTKSPLTQTNRMPMPSTGASTAKK
jgi:hypothetical protein